MNALALVLVLLAASPDPSLPTLNRELFRVPYPGLRAVRAEFPADGAVELRAGYEVSSYYRTDTREGWAVREWAELWSLDLGFAFRRGRLAGDARVAVHRLERSYFRANLFVHDDPQEYQVQLLQGGGERYEPERGTTGLGDLSLGVTYSLTPPERPARLLARAVVEIPTGKESVGFGHGGIDVGLGLRGERRWDRWAAAIAAGIVEVDGGEAFGRLRPRDHVVAEVSGAWRITPRWASAWGVSWSGSPYARPELPSLNDDGYQLTLSASYEHRPSRRLEGWFVQDPFAPRGQPDFSSGIAFRWTLP